MKKQTGLTEGEILKLLADRSDLSKAEIAHELRIKATTLSKNFQKEKISPKIKHEASRLFGVPLDIFNGGEIQKVILPEIIQEPPPPEYRTGATWQDIAEQERKMQAEIARLKEENRQLLLRMAEKEGIIADKQSTIEELFALLRTIRKKDE